MGASQLEIAAEPVRLQRMAATAGLRSEPAEPSVGREAEQAIVLDLERRHGQALFGFVRRMGVSDAQAADAVQEVLLRLWAELIQGRSVAEPRAWAFRTIYRLAMDQHRLKRRLLALADRLGRGGAESSGSARDADDRIAVWAEVDRLPERQRHVLYLRYRADLSFEQIASVMGITSSAARSHATQALARLRRRLADDEAET
jgi:RNA polymerase sigma factor (sigma-70 family)